jgi:tetratricopeptide (TPR) repeat protein
MDEHEDKAKSPQDVPETPPEETFDDLDKAMAWLEQLAAKQGAPAAELPSLRAEQQADSGEDADWLRDLPQAAPPGDDVLDWALPLDDAAPVDELPDWLDLPLDVLRGAAPDATPDAAPDATAESAPDEDQLDWLNQLTESVGTEELPTMHWPKDQASASKIPSIPDAPDVVEPVDEAEEEDAMAWLEKLAAGQGDPIEELPTMLADSAEPSPLHPSAAAAEAEPPPVEADAAGMEDADDAMDWLEQLAVDQSTPLEDLPSVADRVLASAIMSELEGDVPIAEADAGDAPLPEEERVLALEAAESEEAAAESAAAPVEAAAEEPVEIEEAPAEPAAAPVEAAAEEPVEIEEAPAEPAAVPVEAAAEEPVEIEEAPAEPAAVPVEAAAEEPVEIEEAPAEEPVEIEEAPAEPAAVPVEAVAEEPVEVEETADVEPETTAEIAPAAPALTPELAEALDYLERLAAEQGVDLAQVSVDRAPATADLETALARLDGLAGETAVTTPPPAAAPPATELADLSAEMPEDPDEALAWLERLAHEAALTEGELVASQEEIEAVDELPTPVSAGRAAESAPEAPPPAVPAVEDEPDFLSEMPDDPDEAMAWLERLAARQGAPRAELPSLQELADDELSDWIEPAAAPAEASAPDEAPAAAGDVAAPPEVEEAQEIEAPTAVDLPESAEPELPATAPVLEDELTWAEWLAGREFDEDTLPSPDVDDLAWLDSLAEADAEAWLAGVEAEAAASGLHVDAAAQVDELPTSPEAPTRPWMAAPDEPDTTSEPDAAVLDVDIERLTQAREALAGGDLVAAAETYQALVTQQDGLAALIADLEKAVNDYPTSLPFYRLLGDAYMDNGQLQKAVETYRRALDNL